VVPVVQYCDKKHLQVVLIAKISYRPIQFGLYPQAKYTSSRFLNPLVLVVIAEYNIVSVDKSIAS
ncbi:MAG: hypothetical protein WAJ93_05370, partial [Candidatus Nitrosopolaris sp.]